MKAVDTGSPAAVIELGSSSVRMKIAQPTGRKGFEAIATMDLPVGLGRESFTTGSFSAATTERCVAALRKFQEVLREYAVDQRRLRVVATSAVREARNRDLFTDRIRVATGLEVDVLDEVDVSRLTYQAVHPQLKREPFFRTGSTLVVEVGGGSTEILAFRKGRVDSAHVHRWGSLRMLRELGDSIHTANGMELIGSYLEGPVSQMISGLDVTGAVHIVAVGGEMRMLRESLGLGADDARGLHPVETAAVRGYIEERLQLPFEELARQEGLSEHQAELLLQSASIYVALAEAAGARRILSVGVSLRDGVLAELFEGREWERDFRSQTYHSAKTLAKKYGVDVRRSAAVAACAQQLYDFMRTRAVFDPQDETLLHVAAVLHEIGMFVRARSYHKHTYYLIENSEIFGLNAHEIHLVALIARYHRRSTPQPTHLEFAELPPDDRVRVAMLAAILRVAAALEFNVVSGGVKLAFAVRRDNLVIAARTAEELTVLQSQVADRADLFEAIYGLKVDLQPWREEEQNGDASRG